MYLIKYTNFKLNSSYRDVNYNIYNIFSIYTIIIINKLFNKIFYIIIFYWRTKFKHDFFIFKFINNIDNIIVNYLLKKIT